MDTNHLDDGFIRRKVSHRLRALDPDHQTIVTEHEYDLEASRPSRFFQRRYTWTGHGAEGRPVVHPHADKEGHTTHRLQGPVILEEARGRLMVVDLGTTLKVTKDGGETSKLRISHRFVDTAGDFNRRLGHIAYEGCIFISLRVTLPRGEWPMECVTRRVDESKVLERVETAGRDLKVGRALVTEYLWEIENPHPNFHYALDWKVD